MSRGTTTINVTASVITPRVPNFIQQVNGTWLPLCALSEDGLKKLGDAFTKELLDRAKAQSKDPDQYYKKANLHEVDK
jgi:hypothetical protein